MWSPGEHRSDLPDREPAGEHGTHRTGSRRKPSHALRPFLVTDHGWDCPEFSWLKGLVVSRGFEGHVYCLKLDGSELTEAALPALTVVGPLDPDNDREA